MQKKHLTLGRKNPRQSLAFARFSEPAKYKKGKKTVTLRKRYEYTTMNQLYNARVPLKKSVNEFPRPFEGRWFTTLLTKTPHFYFRANLVEALCHKPEGRGFNSL
jgi:hypothetical protein